MYCPKCDDKLAVEKEEEKPQVKPEDQEDGDDMYPDFEYTPPNPDRDLYSKKMGEYLLQGWAMLAEYCDGAIIRLHASSDEEGRKDYLH